MRMEDLLKKDKINFSYLVHDGNTYNAYDTDR